MFLSKLSRKCFSDLGQAIPIIDLPEKKKNQFPLYLVRNIFSFWSIVFI